MAAEAHSFRVMRKTKWATSKNFHSGMPTRWRLVSTNVRESLSTAEDATSLKRDVGLRKQPIETQCRRWLQRKKSQTKRRIIIYLFFYLVS